VSDYQHDLDALRAAAHNREWTPAQDTLKRLLTRLDPLIALTVPAEAVRAFLPRFEAYYPEATWVRDLALTVVSYASAPNDLPEIALRQFPSPGCGNYVSAVFDLARAVQPKSSDFERYSFMTNAAANALLADLMDFYYRDHLDEWTQLTEHGAEIDPATGQPVSTLLYGRFWLDAGVAARDTALWLGLADTVAARLEAEA
jgi:hypothetical protein